VVVTLVTRGWTHLPAEFAVAAARQAAFTVPNCLFRCAPRAGRSGCRAVTEGLLLEQVYTGARSLQLCKSLFSLLGSL
jgi:hypothetical protein